MSVEIFVEPLCLFAMCADNPFLVLKLSPQSGQVRFEYFSLAGSSTTSATAISRGKLSQHDLVPKPINYETALTTPSST